MNSRYGITPQNLLGTLPEVLYKDEKMHALATAIAQRLTSMAGEVEQAAIYARIDTLPEDILDALAVDFKVDWWSFDYTIEEKRKTLKDSWYVHRHLGTKKAVERSISAVYGGTEVSEWFEYGGEPYHFRITVPNLGATQENISNLFAAINISKNLRSVLEYMSIPIRDTAPATPHTHQTTHHRLHPHHPLELPMNEGNAVITPHAIQAAHRRIRLHSPVDPGTPTPSAQAVEIQARTAAHHRIKTHHPFSFGPLDPTGTIRAHAITAAHHQIQSHAPIELEE